MGMHSDCGNGMLMATKHGPATHARHDICNELTKTPMGEAEHLHVCCAASWSGDVFAGYAAARSSFSNTSVMVVHLATLSMWIEK